MHLNPRWKWFPPVILLFDFFTNSAGEIIGQTTVWHDLKIDTLITPNTSYDCRVRSHTTAIIPIVRIASVYVYDLTDMRQFKSLSIFQNLSWPVLLGYI
jgi:hypothetical protein